VPSFFSSGFSLPFSPPPRSCGFPTLLLLFFNLHFSSFFLRRPLSSSHRRRRFRPSPPPPTPIPSSPAHLRLLPPPPAPSLPSPSPSFPSTHRSSCLAAPGPIPPRLLAVVPIHTPQLVPRCPWPHPSLAPCRRSHTDPAARAPVVLLLQVPSSGSPSRTVTAASSSLPPPCYPARNGGSSSPASTPSRSRFWTAYPHRPVHPLVVGGVPMVISPSPSSSGSFTSSQLYMSTRFSPSQFCLPVGRLVVSYFVCILVIQS
jgi:hypothetical protein